MQLFYKINEDGTMILDKYLKQTKFDSYQEFRDKFEILIPDNFNFAWDVVDEIALSTPGKTAKIRSVQ